jgi:3-dehydroquinate dehydratase/shikimate dehydrogenase
MLCIAVAPVSRQLGKVDLLNAAPQCDLIEFRLDRLGKTPDIPELMEGVSKPILISCRRQADGGGWDDSEDERLLLLRNAIVAGPAYVELELDIAPKIPRFGKTKRVVSYTSLNQPLTGIEAIYEQCVKAQADVVKLVGPTPTLDAAWPLLAAVSKKRDVPIVGMGLGQPGLMFSLLGRKYGSPWIYAALEKGMEAYEGQSTVTELEEIYHWKDIGRDTSYLAVTGFGPTEALTVKLLNGAFSDGGMNIRCLPLDIGRSDKFSQMLDTLHVNVMLSNSRLAEKVLGIATNIEEAARVSQYSDLVVKQADGWTAYNTVWRSALKVLERSLGAASPGDRPLDKRNVFLIGSGGPARGVAYGILRRKGLLSVSAADDVEARQMAQQFNARFVPNKSLYDTLADLVIITDAAAPGERTTGLKLNPSFLRPNMTVTDLSRLPFETELLSEARLRGCKVIEPLEIYTDQLASLIKTITGQQAPESLVEKVRAEIAAAKELG